MEQNNITNIKFFKCCDKCGEKLPEGSTSRFCSDWCKSEFYKENAKEEIACYREWRGRD